jgi:hypothetical protein
MKATLVLAILACAYAAWVPSGSTARLKGGQTATPRETRVPVGGAELYAREIGKGTSVIVLHGGPDFDHSYLLPELDRLSDAFHLIDYDQRGRGSSAHRATHSFQFIGNPKSDRRYSGSGSIGFNGFRADEEPRRELF